MIYCMHKYILGLGTYVGPQDMYYMASKPCLKDLFQPNLSTSFIVT